VLVAESFTPNPSAACVDLVEIPAPLLSETFCASDGLMASAAASTAQSRSGYAHAARCCKLGFGFTKISAKVIIGMQPCDRSGRDVARLNHIAVSMGVADIAALAKTQATQQDGVALGWRKLGQRCCARIATSQRLTDSTRTRWTGPFDVGTVGCSTAYTRPTL
jgi:hypothetical protein